MTHKEKYFLTKTALHPKVVESLIGAAGGAIGGAAIGAGGAYLIPHKFDVNRSSYELTLPGGKRVRGRAKKKKGGKGYVASYTRDPGRQALRTGLLGALIGSTRPWVEAPIRKLIREKTEG